MAIWYCTREEVKSALDSKETARNNAQIDRSIESSTELIEGLTTRKFYPEIGTRYFNWPSRQQGTSYKLWLDLDLISVSSLVTGGVTIAPSGYNLEPINYGPPYRSVELKLNTASYFGGGSTPQRDIAIAGLWGYRNDESNAGALAAAITTVGAVTANITDSTLVGVGQLIRIDSERLVVTAKNMLTTTQTLLTPMTAKHDSVTVAVTNGAAFSVGEVILLDVEKMLITDIAGNNLAVKRAWDGSVLATHTGSTIYAPRTISIERGVLGTTAATHLISAPILKWKPPTLVKQLAIAESMSSLQQEGSGYARVVGAGDTAREASGKGLLDLREQTRIAHGVRGRVRSS